MFPFSNGQMPSGEPDTREKISGDYSLLAFALFLYCGISVALSFGISKLLAITGFFGTDFYLSNAGVIRPLLSTLPMYVFGIPVFFLVLKRRDRVDYPHRTMSFPELLVLFLISRFLVLVGALVSNFFISMLESVSGTTSTDAATELVMEMPTWLTVLLVVIVGPIVEEWLFRRSVIDRLAGYGRPFAVLFSALLFAMAHGNFYQFFYTFLLGLVFGYVYAVTGKISYVIGLHALTNFLGSVAVLPIEKLLLEYTDLLPALAENGNTLAVMTEFGVARFFALFSFIVVRYGVALIGLVLLLMYKKTIARFAKEPETLPANGMTRAAFINPGFILFFALSVFVFIYEF